jgi:hypothetical protein
MHARVCRIAPVQNPRRAALCAPAATRRADRASREPIDTLGRRWARQFAAASAKRVRGGGAKSRPRLPVEALEGAKPKGAASGQCAKPMRAVRHSRKGQSPGTAAHRAGSARAPSGAAARVYRWVKRYVGASVAETQRIPSERGKLRRVNPMSAAGVKQNRRGTEGSKPSRG